MTTRADLSRRAFVAGLAPAILRANPKPVNVVFFMTDDHGSWANSIYGCSEIRTPNVERLAREGTRFTNAFAATPVCSPSRMTWMTGLMPSAHGVQDYLVPEDSFGPAARRWLEGKPAYSEFLARAGYTLGMTGKWHMGLDDTAQAGFSYWATVPGGGGPYKDAEFVVNGAKRRVPGFKEDGIGDFAVEFIQQTKAKPFFLLMPFYAPHTPYDFQPEQDRAPYTDSTFSCFPDTPQHPNQNPSLRNNHRNAASKRAYSSLITGMDRNIGRVLAKLDELRLRENTLVIFSADQGWNAGQHGVWGKGNGTIPFNMYEESIRVPLVWSLPGRIASGAVSAEAVSNYDFFPTILDFLGVPHKPAPLQVGRSYAPVLAGQSLKPRNALFFEYCYTRAMRTAKAKLVARTREWPSELYDLERDPGETRNIVDDPAFAEVRASMMGGMEKWFSRAGAPSLETWRTTTRQKLFKY